MGKVKKNNNRTYVNDLYFNDLKLCVPLQKYEENELIKLAQNGDIKARNEVVKANLRYVVTIANKYSKFDVPLNELISEGNLALFKAIEKFDTSKDVKFYCYAVWWIRQYIQSYINKNLLLSKKEVNDKGNIDDGDNDRSNTYAELLSIQDMSADEFENNFFNDISSENLDKEDDEDNNERDNEDDSLFGDKAYISKVLNDLMGSLSNRERNIIRKYFGFDGDSKNLEEIGIELNITQERVRQIKSISINKMRQEILLKPSLMNIYKI